MTDTEPRAIHESNIRERVAELAEMVIDDRHDARLRAALARLATLDPAANPDHAIEDAFGAIWSYGSAVANLAAELAVRAVAAADLPDEPEPPDAA